MFDFTVVGLLCIVLIIISNPFAKIQKYGGDYLNCKAS